ncbi:hypothetical protein ABTE85_23785, partial [Acinetobacter baumannii]
MAWTADGRELVSLPDVIEDRVADLRSRVVAVAVDGGAQREVLGTAANLSIDEVGVAPDGAIFLRGNDVGDSG